MDIIAKINELILYLPAPIQNYWWAVLLVVVLLLLLIIVNLPKLFKRKPSTSVETFKKQNLVAKPAIQPTPKLMPQIPSGNLNAYIQAQLDADVDEATIVKKLNSLGWNKSIIEEALSKARKP